MRCSRPLALVPAEGDVSRSVPSLLHQRLVELSSGPGVDRCPAVFAVVLQAGHVGAEERSKLPPAARALALIAQLVIQDIWLHFHPFINLPVLQLNKAGTDGCNVALLIGEGHSSCAFWILEFRV